MSNIDQQPPEVVEAVRKFRGQFRTTGIALIILGALAVVFPLVFSIAAKVLLGWVFLLTGGALLYHAFQAKRWESAIWSGLIAVLHLALGVYMAFFALNGLVGLTFLVGVVFVLQGGVEGMIAMQHRHKTGWGWLALNGAVTLILGFVLIAGLPGTALWAIGLLLGINFLTTGVAFVALAGSVSEK
ncbi:HdeD family acid-resistance protein [Yoonia maritima]|uniref:HdeD family acid-resistance protein n=1 Tax=Yoonia maritima TaxID=1435347 RepID=UPI000D10E18A|nr:HdeD family acid-resistance protein [Yoonia maritima]